MARHLAVNEQGFRLHYRPIRDSDIPKLCLPLPRQGALNHERSRRSQGYEVVGTCCRAKRASQFDPGSEPQNTHTTERYARETPKAPCSHDQSGNGLFVGKGCRTKESRRLRGKAGGHWMSGIDLTLCSFILHPNTALARFVCFPASTHGIPSSRTFRDGPGSSRFLSSCPYLVILGAS